MSQEFEYRIKTKSPEGVELHTPETKDPGKAGESYRRAKKYANSGESIELQKRPIGKWETVEKETKE